MFAVGAFLAFTLSQAGMVLHWMRQGDASSISKAALNALGCLATGTALCIVPYRKFAEGARFSLLFIAGMVIAFQRIRAHYDEIRAERSLHGLAPALRPGSPARAVVPISGVHRGIINAVRFAQYISSDVTGVYVELEPDSGVKVEAQWKEWWPDVSLVVVPSPYRSLIGALLVFSRRQTQNTMTANWQSSCFQSLSPRDGGRICCTTRRQPLSRRRYCMAGAEQAGKD